MGIMNELLANRVLIAGISGWASAQVIKAILYTILNKEFRLERLFGDGGMPSGHSATVVSLATVSALVCGLSSFEFAVTAILAIIVCNGCEVRIFCGCSLSERNNIVIYLLT
jgi:acid phosphatase family membrane protein YuiD